MPNSIRIRSGSTGKHWPEAGSDDSCTLASFRTGSVWRKPDSQPELNRIRDGFAQYYPGRLWKNGTEYESGKLVVGRLRSAKDRARWFLHTSLRLHQTCLAKPRPGYPDRIWVGFTQYDPCLLWKNGTEMDAEVGSGIYDPGRLWLHAGRNGHKWQ